MAPSESGWNEYERLVLHELKRLSMAIEAMSDIQQEQSLSIERLKLKSGFIATISGFITALGFDLGKNFFK